MGRDKCRWSGRESYNAGNPKTMQSMHAATMREAQVCCTVQGSTKKCATVRDAWRCYSSVEVREGALVSNK